MVVCNVIVATLLELELESPDLCHYEYNFEGSSVPDLLVR
jgi:hypothetical protein